MTGKEEAPSMSGNSARGNDRNTNTYEGETTMNDVTKSLPARPTFAELCPVIGCDRTEADHDSADQSENLHTRIGGSWDLPCDAWPIMDAQSWPRWVLHFDSYASSFTSEEFFALLKAVEGVRKAVDELNAAVDVPALLALRDAARAEL